MYVSLAALRSLAAEDDFISLDYIAAVLEVSPSLMEQNFGKLRKVGLVVGARGPGGGYKLNQPAEEISVFDIFNTIKPRERFESQPVSGLRPTDQVIAVVGDELENFLGKFPLQLVSDKINNQ